MDASFLLSFDKATRRIWMFPRNIRDIAPWKLYHILNVLMQFNGKADLHNPNTQQVMYALLDEIGLKRPADTKDKNPGGMRTYFAQLQCLGLVYPKNAVFHLTVAGDNLIEGNNPLKVLQMALLRHQYPSTYGLGQNVRIDPRMRVKPFLFILQLLHDERLGGYLTSEDVRMPVIYGHNPQCYEFVVRKILEYREDGDFLSCLEDPDRDLYTPRGSGDVAKAQGNIKDIANTALNYLKAGDLINEDLSKVFGKKSYHFNENYEHLYQRTLREKDCYIGQPENPVSFQRAYGRYDKEKDLRTAPEKTGKKKTAAETLIQMKYMDFIKTRPFSSEEDEVAQFIPTLYSFGLNIQDISQVIKPIRARKGTLEDDIYMEYARSGGTKSNEFEVATTAIMKKLGFVDSEWIGRRHSVENWRGNFPDVFIKKTGTNECGLADAKATSTYSLGHDDMLKMKDTYIHTNKELDPQSTLKYFLYIAGGFKGNIEASIKQLSDSVSLPVTAVTAEAMLELLHGMGKGWTTERIQAELFESGELVNSDTVVLHARMEK